MGLLVSKVSESFGASWRMLWDLPAFRGNPYVTITSITPGTIATSRTSGEVPFFFHASASAVTAVGTSQPYEDLEFKWTLAPQAGGSITDNEGLRNPNNDLAVNPYTDQVGPEAFFVLREAGTYTLTLDIRGQNSPFETGQATATITANAYTGTHVWVDNTNGNDANDGLDPWGFNVSGGTYTDSTKNLESTNAFTSYDHDAATAPAKPHLKYNFIYLDAGAGITPGLYEIASKTDNSNIVLASSAGSDSTSDVGSSDGPEASIQAPADDVWQHVRAGTYSVGTLTFAQVDHARMSGYSSAPTFNGTATPILDYSSGSSQNPTADLVTQDIIFDGNATSERILLGTFSNTSGGNTKIYFDNVTAQGCVGNTTNSWTIQYFGSSDLDQIGWWNCVFDQTENSLMRQNLIYKLLGDWAAIVGGSFTTQSASTTLDHHIYPNGDPGNHRLFKWINFLGDAGNTGYCINSNTGSATPEYLDYILESECCFGGASWATDASDGQGNAARKHRNMLIDACGIHSSLDVGGTFFRNAETMTWRDCASMQARMIDLAGPQTGSQSFDIKSYRNKIYSPSGGSGNNLNTDETTNVTLTIRDNEYHCDRTTSAFYDTQVDEVDSLTADGNTYYTPNSTNDAWAAQSFTTWEAESGVTNETEGDPGFSDPANGDFR